MIFRTLFAATALVLAAGPVLAQAPERAPTGGRSTDLTPGHTPRPANSIQGKYETRHQYDLDHDGKVSLAEAKSAAAFEFDRLDKDRDGTLDREELGDRVGDADMAAVDGDHDGTLSKAEYLALVQVRFRAVQPDLKAQVAPKQMSSGAGRALRQLLP